MEVIFDGFAEVTATTNQQDLTYRKLNVNYQTKSISERSYKGTLNCHKRLMSKETKVVNQINVKFFWGDF